MAGEKFYLDFKSDAFGKVEINEPINFNSVDFQLNQKDKGYARDISFNGGETQFEFVTYRNHYLEQILYYNHFFGFESKVDLIIEKSGTTSIIGELDFATAITDDLEYFKCKVIQQSSYQIIKRRKSVKVDLFSSIDVDGNSIEPLVPSNVLLLSKPVIQKSVWEQSGVFSKEVRTSISNFVWRFNPCANLINYGIEDSYTFFENFVVNYNDADGENFVAVKAKNKLKNIKVNISGLDLLMVNSATHGTSNLEFIVKHGKTFDTATKIILLSALKYQSETYAYSNQDPLIINIPNLDRDSKIWIYFQLTNSELVRQAFANQFTIKNMITTITAESTSYNSVTPSFRLVDVMNQVVKSISGLPIYAPAYDLGGTFYDTRLFNGNLLRNIIDKPFYISLEDIEKSITEMNADYEIDKYGQVFFGLEADFYKATESGFFDNTQFSEMNKTFNPRFAVNEFSYSYKNFQSLKENEELNSADTIHGESKWVFFNKKVENKKEVTVEWTRDAFLIESVRRKSVIIEADTASQDDDNIFALDTVETDGNVSFNESTVLSHTYNTSTAKLSLRNEGDINFIVLGIKAGTTFTIVNTPDNNAGDYIVYAVSPNELQLTRTSSGVISTSNDGIRSTAYIYTIMNADIPFTNYTNQNFTVIDNLSVPDSYSNLRYSVKRNINNYWQSYLATCNLYHKLEPIRNTWYKNNGLCTTTYFDNTVTENATITPSNPILSPFLYNEIVFANVEFEDYMTLQSNIRSQRGFIRTIDNNQKVIKLYPVTMKYDNLSKELSIKGEEKFEDIFMTISTSESAILINNETRVKSLDWEIVDNKLYLYDKRRERLYNGVYFNNVAVNGATTEDVAILTEWLNLL